VRMNITIFPDHNRIGDAQAVIDIYITIQARCWIAELDFDRLCEKDQSHREKKELPIGTEAWPRAVMLVNPPLDRVRARVLHGPICYFWNAILSRKIRTSWCR
jgi:hypothetical protein